MFCDLGLLESFGCKHHLGKLTYVQRWRLQNSNFRLGWKAKTQSNAQLIEQCRQLGLV